jgi:hypothetical protein
MKKILLSLVLCIFMFNAGNVTFAAVNSKNYSATIKKTIKLSGQNQGQKEITPAEKLRLKKLAIEAKKLQQANLSQFEKTASYTPLNVADSLALVDLYNSTNGASWKNTLSSNRPWLVGKAINWYNVTIDAGRVIELSLPDNNLNGTLPSSIGNLTELITLNLSTNSLTGSFPPEIGALSNLVVLFLNHNQLYDRIPSAIGNLINLNELDLSENNFSGDFPDEVSNDLSLINFHINNNQFTGNVLSNFAPLTYITKINISNNYFSGPIPTEVGETSFLDELHINNNNYFFKDIEPIFNWTNYSQIVAFDYSNQAKVGELATVQKFIGESIHLSITGYEPSPDDKFQWYKDGDILSEKVDSFFTIPNIIRSDAGNFYCSINNENVSGLTLTSEDISLVVLNHIPVANAGSDQTVNERTVGVTLNGSGSSDADGDHLTYSWLTPPEIVLSSNTAVNPTFTAPEVTEDDTFKIILTVYDGYNYSLNDTVAIIVKQVNRIPVANAGTDQVVNEGTLVTLDGSASSDPDLQTLTYLWTPPAGFTLSDATVAQPTFTAPDVKKDTIYKIALVVNDGIANSVSDTVAITVKLVNQIPVANAGPDQTVTEGTLVTLDGSASSDPDGHTITYLWTSLSGATLSSATAKKPTFTAPDVSSDTPFKFKLVVNDGYENSEPDTVTVTVQNSEGVPETLSVQNVDLLSSQRACYNASQTITVSGTNTVILESGSSAEFIAGHNILFEPGFHAVSGCFMHAHISTTYCTKSAELPEPVVKASSAVTTKEIKVYPNPSSGKVTVDLLNYENPVRINVFNSLGVKVFSTSALESVSIDLSNAQKGFYILQVVSEDHINTQKFMIR